MGQEQSYIAQGNLSPVKKYQDKYENQIQYTVSNIEYRSSEYDRKDYIRYKPRRSTESYKSDNSSTESSGYRSSSSANECSDRSSSSYYFCSSLYKNDHYKNANKDLYRPVKIPKDKRYKQLFDTEDTKNTRLKGYVSDTEKAKSKVASSTKKTGIRNYTPKILSAEEQRKKLENWI
ncbi:unnamed protein product [Danaus chrysippus]|uniref:(African queen) hypothetical protein n=1 Tax=Danaus chrysippus TaxID=151541 RepID=A0A8J2QBM8_9NEOP|nr:unnamed protein product [Danaus chrysippus]